MCSLDTPLSRHEKRYRNKNPAKAKLGRDLKIDVATQSIPSNTSLGHDLKNHVATWDFLQPVQPMSRHEKFMSQHTSLPTMTELGRNLKFLVATHLFPQPAQFSVVTYNFKSRPTFLYFFHFMQSSWSRPKNSVMTKNLSLAKFPAAT